MSKHTPRSLTRGTIYQVNKEFLFFTNNNSTPPGVYASTIGLIFSSRIPKDSYFLLLDFKPKEEQKNFKLSNKEFRCKGLFGTKTQTFVAKFSDLKKIS